MFLIVTILSALLGGLVGGQIARWRFLRLLRRLNSERDVRDQAMGADLIRQAERMIQR